MKKNQIDIITMGCSKNLVDSELLMKQFEANGYHCVHDSKRPQGEIAVINTCGFIESAKEESINTILEFVARKKYGHLNKLFVMGCLSQRYKSELEREIPEVDKFYGKFNYKQLLTDLGKAEVAACDGVRHLTTPRHYAYLKIAEGCDRHCAYCAIPIITGSHKSRPMDEVLQEVRELVAQGVTEIQVIAQELTYYGGIALRTTLMVGFPGETEADFIELMDFVRWAKFERMGAFAYSEEEGTFAANHYEDNIPAETKQRRLDQLMAVQQEVSAEIEAAQVGRVLEVVIDRKEGDYYVGRTEYSSPEVDPEVLIPVSDGMLRVGTFYQVEITDSSEFDLYGKRVKKSKRATE